MNEKKQSFFFSRQFALVCLAAAGGYFLLMQHWQHVVEFLPYIVLLLCPLMHLFMHGGHRGHSSHDAHQDHDCHHDQNGQKDKDGDIEHAYRRGLEEGRKQGGTE